MTDPLSKPCTAFRGDKILIAGALVDVALSVRKALDEGVSSEDILIFEDVTGKAIDLDLRGEQHEIIQRLKEPPQPHVSRRPGARQPAQEEARGRGRPKLGVVAREVTLLPRHWDWLNIQPGGASIALRKLVEEARRSGTALQRERHEAAYRFMQGKAGDLPGFEEATRALFANDDARFEAEIRTWPRDILTHAMRLAFPDKLK